jgi:hypothetical protein
MPLVKLAITTGGSRGDGLPSEGLATFPNSLLVVALARRLLQPPIVAASIRQVLRGAPEQYPSVRQTSTRSD